MSLRANCFGLLAATALALGCHAPAFAQETSAGGADQKVSIEFRGTPFRDAIRDIFKGSGLQYTIDPNIPNVPIDLVLRDVGLAVALRVVTRQAATSIPGLTHSRDGDVYVFKIQPVTRPPAQPAAQPPAQPAVADSEVKWERIGLQYVDVRAVVTALQTGYVPTDFEVMLQQRGFGGFGGGGGTYIIDANGFNSYGGGFGGGSVIGNYGPGYGNGGFGGFGGYGSNGYGSNGYGGFGGYGANGRGSLNYGRGGGGRTDRNSRQPVTRRR